MFFNYISDFVENCKCFILVYLIFLLKNIFEVNFLLVFYVFLWVGEIMLIMNNMLNLLVILFVY